MSTTVTEALTRLRVDKLREPTAKQWSDATLIRHISDSNAEIFRMLGQIPNAGFDEVQETLTLPANASTVSLTPGTPPAALTYGVAQVKFIDHLTTSGIRQPCTPLPQGYEYALRGTNVLIATGDVAPMYRLRRPNFVFLPIASVARTLYVTYRPMAVALTAGATNLDIPDDQVPHLVVRAAVLALSSLGENETQYDGELAALQDAMFAAYNPSLAAGRSYTVKNVEGRSQFQGA